MLAVFGISYFVSETVINESQTTANDIRAKQAFFAAQSGIDFYRVSAEEIDCSSPCSVPDTLASVTVSELVSGSLYMIQSTGFSDDSSVSRTISYAVGRLPAEINPPKVPIGAKGGLGLTGNVKAVNNEEQLTVWSGSDFGVNGSANTYIKLDKNYNQLSTIKTPGGNNITGPDVITDDPNLSSATSSALLSAFFGKSSLSEFASDVDYVSGADPWETYDIENDWDDRKVYYSSGPIDLQTSYLSKKDIPTASITAFENENGANKWDLIETSSEVAGNGFSTSGFYIGSPSSPVLIASDDTVTIGSGVRIFGVIIAKNVVLQGGNPEIIGGLVVLDSAADAMSGNGNPTVIMESSIIDNATNPRGYGPIKSSWRDW